MNNVLEIDLSTLDLFQSSKQVTEEIGASELMQVPQQVEIAAKDKLVFHCGKSSLTLYSDGRIVLRGEYILSEAEDCNRVAGGRVELN